MTTATAPAEQGTPTPAVASPPAAPVQAAATTTTAPTAPAATPPAAVSQPAATLELSVPTGVTFDAARVAEIKSLATANGMTTAQAQALLASEIATKQQSDASFKALVETGWPETIKADPVLGGANYARTQARTEAVITALSVIPEFKPFVEGQFIREPHMVRLWNWIGEQMGDSKLVTIGQPLGKQASFGKRQFPNTPDAWTQEERDAANAGVK